MNERKLREGMVEGATIIAAPSLTKNARQEHAPQIAEPDNNHVTSTLITEYPLGKFTKDKIPRTSTYLLAFP